MKIVSTLVLLASIAWLIAQLWTTRRKLRRGEVVMPPLFAGTLLFGLCILLVLALGRSSLHLLWLFPVSSVAGVLLLTVPGGAKFIMACLGLLACLKPHLNR